MIVIAIAAGQNSDRHRRAEVLATQVLASSEQLSAFKWQTNTEVVLGQESLSHDGALIHRGYAIEGALGRVVTQLRRVAPGPQTARLASDVDALLSAAVRVFMLNAGSNAGSVAVQSRMQHTFQPALDRLTTDAQRTATQQQRIAARAREVALWASVGSLVIGMLALAAVMGRFARSQRQATIERERRGSEARVRALFEDSTDVVAVLGEDRRIRWITASVRDLIGLEASELIGSTATDLVHGEDRSLLQSILVTASTRDASTALNLRVQHADGSWRHVEGTVKNRIADAAIEGIVVSLRDVTERQHFEDELRHHAFHDALTGLPNRALFEDRLRQALGTSLRTGAPLAVLFIDLDDFKTINDSLGHPTGDSLLRAIAARLDPLMRPSDTIARLGGDEFAVLADGAAEHDARAIAARMLTELGRPFELEGRELSIAASIGLAASDSATRAEDLLRNADIAMYAAKAAGKSAVRSFDPSMHRDALHRLELSAELPQALAGDELVLRYQPIVSIGSGAVRGVESLIRWQHPRRGLLGPGEFIPLAEETGQIVEIGRWVLEHACAQARAWQLAHPECPPLYIAVNVSVRQLRDPDFPDTVAEILERTGLSADLLVLEITESMLAADLGVVREQLAGLKALGLRIAVDDFGTGYSSLSHLQQFPVDVLKIDKSFIDQLAGEEPDTGLVQTILRLADTMALDVIAEGIERTDQRDRLLQMRSPVGQGFLFSKPVEPERIEALLASGSTIETDPVPDAAPVP